MTRAGCVSIAAVVMRTLISHAFTLAQLAQEYLDDSEVRALGRYATIEQRLAWWVEHYGTVRRPPFPRFST